MSATRVHMRNRVRIGQRWQRRKDGTIWTVRQIHRADREVELLPEWLQPPASRGVVHRVSFRDLSARWRQVGP